MTDAFVIEVLSSSHDGLAFTSGSEVLDRYLQSQASQDVRRRISNCFVAVPPASTIIAGYYTLAASSIPLTDLPEELANRLPRYPVIPAAIIGRLAVDRQYRRRGLGAALLFDAVQRTMRADPAVFTLIVDAKDDDAVAFYRRFGFLPFASRAMSLYLPIATAAKLFES